MNRFTTLRLMLPLMAVAGDIARAAAGAPLTPKTAQTPPVAPVEPNPEVVAAATVTGSRWDRLFTAVIFKKSDNDTVYINERSGKKSRKIASVLIEMAGSGGYIRGNVNAKQNKGDAKAYAEFTFMGTMTQACIVVEDSAAKAEMDAFRARVVNDCLAWAKETGSTPTAVIPTGVALDLSL